METAQVLGWGWQGEARSFWDRFRGKEGGAVGWGDGSAGGWLVQLASVGRGDARLKRRHRTSSMAGREVAVKGTKALGCSIRFREAA